MVQVGARRYDLYNLSDSDLNQLIRAVSMIHLKDRITAHQIVKRLNVTTPEAEALLAKIKAL